MPRRMLSSLRRCVAASFSISARFGRESPCYGRILGRTCVATIRATVVLQGSMLGCWALTLGHWCRSVPRIFALPHDKYAQAVAFIAMSLCNSELFNFCAFWARIPFATEGFWAAPAWRQFAPVWPCRGLCWDPGRCHWAA